MNFSSGERGEQRRKGPVPRLPSSGQIAGEESPNKPIKPKIANRTKLSPSKSFQKRMPQLEDDHIGSKFREDAAIPSSSSEDHKDLLGDERDSLSKPRSSQTVSSPLQKPFAGVKTIDNNTRPLTASPYDPDITKAQQSTQRDEIAKKISRKYADQRRRRSLDDFYSDEVPGRESQSPRRRRTKSEDGADYAFRSLRSHGGRRPQRDDSQERRTLSRSLEKFAQREILALENAKRRESIADAFENRDKNGGLDAYRSAESRSYLPSPERSTSRNSIERILRNYSSGDFSGRSLNVGEDVPFATLNLGRERNALLVDTVPSTLRTPDRYRRQLVGLPTSLLDPKPADRTGGNTTPFSSRLMESTSSDSSDQRRVQRDENDLRFQANLPSCPSVSTRLDESCVALFDGAPNIPQRTFDHEDDVKVDAAGDSEIKAKSNAPFAVISLLFNKSHGEESSISAESSEDDVHSVGSFCPSISECISTGTSMGDEAPKMPGRGMSQLSMESTSALGAMNDDRSMHESRTR